MTAWLSGRRAATTVDRFMAAADPAELTAAFCPPEVTSPGEEDILRCYTYRPTAELARLRSLPEVVGAGRFAYQPVEFRLPTGSDTFESGMLLATGDAEITSPEGAPIVLVGRLADPDAPDEAIINTVVRDAGLRVGDRLTRAGRRSTRRASPACSAGPSSPSRSSGSFGHPAISRPR